MKEIRIWKIDGTPWVVTWLRDDRCWICYIQQLKGNKIPFAGVACRHPLDPDSANTGKRLAFIRAVQAYAHWRLHGAINREHLLRYYHHLARAAYRKNRALEDHSDR